MQAPLYSTVSLVTELFVSAGIVTVIVQGYRTGVFRKRLVALTLAYEALFNVSYMIYRVLTHVETVPHARFVIALAIFHGTLSLAMFIALIAFMIVAWRRYAKGANFFRQHRIMTGTFLFLWVLSILSGVLFYFVEYWGA
ncbi:MAG TPA: hypothetical protein VL500_05395 [Candidatus Eisenbacteria bacterium]|nr:hypothetical protein [Candidatus Eisenbacteria bacterium]